MEETISQKAMMLSLGGGLGDDRLTANVRRLVLALQARGVTDGEVRHEGTAVIIETHLRGRAVIIRVTAERFDLPKELSEGTAK